MNNTLGQGGGAVLGSFRVDTTSNQGHPADFWVENIIGQLIYVADSAPQPIRDQAIAYRESMRVVIDIGVRQAILSNHTTLIAHLKKAGMHEAAALIQTIKP
jgi:hypothetical protein